MKRIFYIIELLAFFAKEVLVSNIKVARDVLHPSPDLTPSFVSIKLGQLNDRQRFFLANMITMTPGTLSLEFSENRDSLLVHTLYGDSAEQLQTDITNNYELRVRRAL